MATSLSILEIIDNDWTEIAFHYLYAMRSHLRSKIAWLSSIQIWKMSCYYKKVSLYFYFVHLIFVFEKKKKELIPKKCCVLIWKAHCPYYIKLYVVQNVKFKNNSRKDAKARTLPYKYRWYNGWQMKERELVVEWQRLHRRWCVQFERKRQL